MKDILFFSFAGATFAVFVFGFFALYGLNQQLDLKKEGFLAGTAHSLEYLPGVTGVDVDFSFFKKERITKTLKNHLIDVNYSF